MENTGQYDEIRADIEALIEELTLNATRGQWLQLIGDVDAIRAAAQVLLDWDNDALTKEQGF